MTFGMRNDIAPSTGFHYRPDAERAQRALLSASIDCTIREPEDAPPGWRMGPSELKFTIWVPIERLEEASRIISESSGSGNLLSCSRCGAAGPTVHITSWQDGTQVTTHFCTTCHSAAS